MKISASIFDWVYFNDETFHDEIKRIFTGRQRSVTSNWIKQMYE